MTEEARKEKPKSRWATRSAMVLGLSLIAGFIEAVIDTSPSYGPPIILVIGLLVAPIFALLGLFLDQDKSKGIQMLLLIGLGLVSAWASLGATGGSVNELIQRVPAKSSPSPSAQAR